MVPIFNTNFLDESFGNPYPYIVISAPPSGDAKLGIIELNSNYVSAGITLGSLFMHP